MSSGNNEARNSPTDSLVVHSNDYTVDDIEYITGRDTRFGTAYRTKWKNYPVDDITWEPEDKLSTLCEQSEMHIADLVKPTIFTPEGRDENFLLKRVIDTRISEKGNREYCVELFSFSENIWKLEKELQCTTMIEEFYERRNEVKVENNSSSLPFKKRPTNTVNGRKNEVNVKAKSSILPIKKRPTKNKP